jgi:hypothetical protein
MSVGAGQAQTPNLMTTNRVAPPGSYAPYMPTVTDLNPAVEPEIYAPFQSSYYGSPQEQMYGSPMTPQQPYAGYYENYRLPGPTYGAGSGKGGARTPTEVNPYSDVAKNQANPQGDYGPSRDVQTGKVTFGRTADGQNIYIDPNTGSAVMPSDPGYGQYSVDASGNQVYTPTMYNQGPDSLGGGAFRDTLLDPIFNQPAPVVPPLAQQQQEIDDFRRREREF